MYFPTTIFLFTTNTDSTTLYQHILSLPKAGTCHIVSIINKEHVALHTQDATIISSSLLITDTIVTPTLPTLGLLPFSSPLQEHSFSIPYAFEGIDSIDDESIALVFCRFHQLPMTILCTKRLVLREWSITDSDALLSLYSQFPQEDRLSFPPSNPIEREQFLSSYINGAYGFYGHGLWCVIEKQTNEIIGQCGIEYKERDGIGRYELQYMISPSYQQLGFAYEITKAICHYAKDVLFIDRLFAFIRTDNIRSLRLIKKLGFAYDSSMYIEDCQFDLYSICFLPTFSI